MIFFICPYSNKVMKEFYFGIVFVLFMSILVKKTGFLIISLLTLYGFGLFISMGYAIKHAWLQACQANQKSVQALLVASPDGL